MTTLLGRIGVDFRLQEACAFKQPSSQHLANAMQSLLDEFLDTSRPGPILRHTTGWPNSLRQLAHGQDEKEQVCTVQHGHGMYGNNNSALPSCV
jgi:hypothetical protein